MHKDEDICGELAAKYHHMEREDPDMRNAIAYAFVKKHDDPEATIKKYESLKNDNDRVAVLVSMGNLKGKEAMEMIFNLAKDGRIKKQDESRYYTSFGLSIDNKDLAFENIERIVARLNEISTGGRNVSNLMSSVLPFLGEGRTDETKKLMDKIRNDKNKLGIAKGLEKLEIFEKLREKYNK